ncbi:FAD-dependent oxidoreductase [Microbacterium lacus]|uniref:protoporphyrinogen/coproporphyrinogen oxidase n=1 Tax=Microbacterium lacus TaxID=415217 RepID=UPI00385101D2
MPDFDVVGGGIAGLVTARRLALGGARVIVHEASDHLGGTLARHEVAGIVLDAGAESFAVRGGVVAALAEELGLAADVVSPAPLAAWLHPTTGYARPLPATSLLGVPADPLAADVVAQVGPEQARRAAVLDLAPVTGVAPESFGALVRGRMGEPVLNLLVAPVVRGVHSMNPDDLTIARAHPALWQMVVETGGLGTAVARLRADSPAGSAVAGLRGGVHRLIDALAGELDRLGVEVRYGSRIDPASHRAARPMVLAAPSDPGAGRKITLVTLVARQDDLDAAPRGTGVLVADGTSRIGARALTHATAKWPWLWERTNGRHVLRLSYDGEVRDADLINRARVDAETLLGVPLPTVDAAAQIVWTRPEAITVSPPDLAAVVGETVAGSGIAGIIAHAERIALDLLVGNSD